MIDKPQNSRATKAAITRAAPTRPSSSQIVEKMKSVVSEIRSNFCSPAPNPRPRTTPPAIARMDSITCHPPSEGSAHGLRNASMRLVDRARQ